MLEFLAVGIGGFVGSCARFALNKLSARFMAAFPLGTLLSNVTAGLLIGFIIGMEQNSSSLAPRTKLLLTTGFLGGLSTFSTFSLETVTLFQSGRYALSAANVLLNLVLSISGVLLGMSLAKLVKRYG